jgi:hypothetical protein
VERKLCGDAVEGGAELRIGPVPERVLQGERPQDVTERAGGDESVGVDGLAVVEQPTRAQPGLELTWRRDVVLREVGNLGIDEVLDEIERRRRRSAPARLKVRSS